MRNADVASRYYNYFNPSEPKRIAFSDRITHAAFFSDVLYRGISQIIDELDIPYDIEVYGPILHVFNDNEDEFKVSWEFDGNTPYSLKIGYYVNDECLDQQVLYDYTTYEEALDFIQDYMSDILTNGVPQEPGVKYDEDTVAQLKLMHSVMQSMNNENAYYTWIMTGVPDGATKEDYIDIASNSEEFDDCLKLFDSLFTKYAPDGLFRPSSDEIAFAKRVCERLGLPSIEI